MKSLIVLVVGLLAVGCVTLTPEEKALRDSVIGEYEHKKPNGYTIKHVYLENGIREWYDNGKKVLEVKWSIVDGEIHVKYGNGLINVFRINADKSITYIAMLTYGKRTDLSKENQPTFKKIK